MTWLQHVNVVVPPGGTADAVRFYTEVFALPRLPKPPGSQADSGAWLGLDRDAQIHIAEAAGHPHEDAHFAVVVDDFDAVLDRIAAAGAVWRAQADVFGGRRGFTRDPAGNRVEVLEASGQFVT